MRLDAYRQGAQRRSEFSRSLTRRPSQHGGLMADLSQRSAKPARPTAAGSHVRRHRETATDRRSRQTAEAITALRDLKREAAERRARKSGS
jgi:hypothetical protein